MEILLGGCTVRKAYVIKYICSPNQKEERDRPLAFEKHPRSSIQDNMVIILSQVDIQSSHRSYSFLLLPTTEAQGFADASQPHTSEQLVDAQTAQNAIDEAA